MCFLCLHVTFKSVLKLLLLATLFLHVNSYADVLIVKMNLEKPPYDAKLDAYPQAKEWYDKSDEDSDAAFNLGYTYQTEIKNYNLAVFWYKTALRLNHANGEAANNLGYLYEHMKEYKKAIKYYEEAIQTGYFNAITNLGRLYHNTLKEDVSASQYCLAVIDKPYTKESIVTFLKNKWHISETDIKKGYELQLRSKIIPEKLKYKGGI